ncbi:sigma-70 family RNA polymerase sigma factor [Cellulomonas sp. APG4]|nr:sigma-70 family RNA polymerase sigma factor [Cellulomonas sp. APG4]
MTEPAPGGSVGAALEAALRIHWARLVALLIGQYGRPDLVEDALAEAFAAATRRWPVDGIPANPAGWLLTAARRRVVDQLRTEVVRRRAEPLMVVDARTRQLAEGADEPGDDLDEDVARLLLTCAHPALGPDARIALTLRFVVGLEAREIARLLLVQEATMAARLTRAKKRLAASGIPFALPPDDRLPERLDVVATVLYLLFTSGYQPTHGDRPLRVDLADEAIRLTRLVDAALPGHAVVRALLALLLLQHSRRDARLDEAGDLVLLPEQNRARWDRRAIAEALTILDALPPSTGQAEEYRLQALIAAEHARAPTSAETRWVVIADLYAELERRTLSPLVRLARAVAVAEHDGPEAGLALLEDLDLALPRHHRLPAVRAELLLRADQPDAAVEQLDRALVLVTAPTERRHLERRRAGALERSSSPDAAGR